MTEQLDPEPPWDALDRRLLPDFLADAEDYRGRMASALAELATAQDTAGALRRLGHALHTLKGSAAMVGDTGLAQYIHIQELWLAGLASAPAGAALTGRLAPIERRLQRLRQRAAGKGVARAENHGPAGLELLAARLQQATWQAAQATGKQAQLYLSANAVPFAPETLVRLAPALEHLLRNAVAHGIEAPGERQRLGKSPIGRIDVEALTEPQGRCIHVRDDGAGIDLAALAKQAVRLGLPASMDLLDLLCQPGLSRASEADLTAGMGMGMAAVQAIVTELGGRLGVDTVPGQGTRFVLRLP